MTLGAPEMRSNGEPNRRSAGLRCGKGEPGRSARAKRLVRSRCGDARVWAKPGAARPKVPGSRTLPTARTPPSSIWGARIWGRKANKRTRVVRAATCTAARSRGAAKADSGTATRDRARRAVSMSHGPKVGSLGYCGPRKALTTASSGFECHADAPRQPQDTRRTRRVYDPVAGDRR
jgi:hypothetical protein